MVARLRCDFTSDVLGLASSMTVLLPEAHLGNGGSATPSSDGLSLLLLLHGLSDDHSMWTRQTALERYVDGTGLAVVMPAVNRSYYTDMAQGLPYWTFISEEVLAAARSFFPITKDRSRCFVAGLSMGGYGAIKLALRHPERFAAAASLSGVLDVAQNRRLDPTWQPEHTRIFGQHPFVKPEDDLLILASALADSAEPRPKLFVSCGTDDDLLDETRTFRDHATRLGFDITAEEHVGEGHRWSYWDRMIQRVIQWLPLRRGA